MPDVAIIGGGPAGLSAGLFTAKNGLETAVFDTDDTWMNSAHLFNYLGIRSIDGTEFMDRARQHAERHGVNRHQGEVVERVDADGDTFTVVAEDGTYEVRYVVFATGADTELAEVLGCNVTEDGTIAVDLDMETSVPDAYATGAMVRPEKWQAIISAGDGGAAALDILSKERGEHFHDFDVPDDT